GDKMLLEAKNRGSIDCRAPNLPKFSAKCRSDREVRQTARRATDMDNDEPEKILDPYFPGNLHSSAAMAEWRSVVDSGNI
ncbi:MAG: hypothetical protein LBF93_13540, partial [Zoogloeaceae bacterium]|nr:hypothetical protein [Zoogloeaceae bacterium]